MRELRLIAAAQAALQPPVALPRARAVAQAHRRGRSRGCPGCARSGTTARPTSARSPAPGRSSSRRRRCTRRSGCASARPGCRPRRPTTACALAEMGRCGAPCDGSESVEAYAAHVAAVPLGDARRRPPGRRRASAAGWPGSPRPSASRTPRCTATGWPPSSGPPPGCSGCPRSPAAPSWSPPGQPDDVGWEIVVVRHGRLVGHRGRRPRRRPAGRRRRPGRHGRGRRRRARARRRPPRPRRPSACCAGSSSPASGWSR